MVGRSEAIANILSAKTVLLFGVPRWRPPRRSPIFEPLGTVLSLCVKAFGPLVDSRAHLSNDPGQVARTPLGRPLLIYCYCAATSSRLCCYSESASGKALREQRKDQAVESVVEDVMEIGRHCALLPLLDERPADEILGYDENGLPQ